VAVPGGKVTIRLGSTDRSSGASSGASSPDGDGLYQPLHDRLHTYLVTQTLTIDSANQRLEQGTRVRLTG
jgi:hypothetical protein